MKKTLIIHPKDESTQFLDIVYKDIPNKTVVTGGLSRVEVVKLIAQHDRIMMMGHGSPFGLFSMGKFSKCYGYIISDDMVKHLRGKECVYIWCYADRFVKYHELEGFYTGMFISEVGEAIHCGVGEVPQSVVDESNFRFCEILSECINEDLKTVHDVVKEQYGKLLDTNPVVSYNHPLIGYKNVEDYIPVGNLR